MERRLAALERELTRDPEDALAWVELARLVERGGHLPAWLDAAALPWVRRAWARRPEERTLARVALPLLGLEPAPPGEAAPGPWWEAAGRLGRAEGRTFDRETGWPLALVRPRDGARMLLVPGGEVALQGLRGPVQVLVAPFYMDRLLVSVGRYLEYLDQVGAAPGGGTRRHGRGAVPAARQDLLTR